MKQMTKAVVLVLCFYILSGCALNQHPNSIQSDIEYLVSDKCSGRLVGTEGNDHAMDFISAQFSEAKLYPLDTYDSFYVPYRQLTVDTEQSVQTITAEYEDGHTETFTAWSDFYPRFMSGNFELRGILVESENRSESCLTLISNTDASRPLAKVILSDTAKAQLLEYHSDTVPNFYVNETVWNRLKEAHSLDIYSNIVVQDSETFNIVGVLPGASHEDALIISAHFDHVGSYGDVIYPGALDNASGVAMLLDLMRQLSAEQIKPNFDIIFCAFNGEDMGLQGSSSFVSIDLPYRRVNAINLDTLGLVGVGKLGIQGEPEKLCQQMISTLQDAGFDVERGDFGASDHMSFLRANIPAITVTDWGLDAYQIIHMPNDTIEQLDIPFLESVSSALFTYVTSSGLILDSLELASGNDLWDNAMEQAAALIEEYHPAHNQVLAFPFMEHQFYARDSSPVYSINEAQQFWPNVIIPETLGEYSFFELSFKEPQNVNLRMGIDSPEDMEPGIAEISNEDKYTNYILSYKGPLDKMVSICVYDNQFYTYDDLLEQTFPEQKDIGKDSFHYLYTEPDDSKTFLGILFYDPALPCSFFIQSYSMVNPLSEQLLEDIILQNIDVLKTFAPIE